MKIGDKTEFENPQRIVRIVASNPVEKQGFVRISVRQLTGKDCGLFYVESFTKTQAFQSKVSCADIADYCEENLFAKFRQVLVSTDNADITYLSNGKGNAKRLVKKAVNKQKDEGQNKKKNYILTEGMPVLPLVDLGVFTKDFKVVNSMYDKYRQINRFVEILDDKFAEVKEPLTVLDFGCGKSYLTFIVHYYFTQIRKQKVKIIGYDLKADVVEKCNRLAAKYNCADLTFVVADVTKDALFDGKVDAVICLHACDVATDYALDFAIKHSAKYIFSVPCCQHEINKNIGTCGGDLDILLKYGIVKERTSALLTDAIRAQILEDCGYNVDVMEFVDLAHSPKNIMLRAELTRPSRQANKDKLESLMQKYGFKQTLFDLVYKQ